MDDENENINSDIIRNNGASNSNNYTNVNDNSAVLNYLTQCPVIIPLWKDSQRLPSLVDKVS